MGLFFNILFLAAFLIEVFVLFYIEKKTWNTLYTPLNFLMLPYTVILLVTVCVAGNETFVPFYYPSILLWSFGLLLFAIPSYALGFLMKKADRPLNSNIATLEMPKIVWYLAVIICLMFIWRFMNMVGSSKDLVGSEDFGLAFCGRGFWGHLRQFSLPLLVMAIYYLDRCHMWLLLIIIVLLFVSFLYQVKGWVIIPFLAGISLRLYSGKSRLRISLLLLILLGAILVFFVAYWLMPILAGGSAGMEIVGFIFGHFFHYLSSGILGLSMDMQNNFPDTGSFEIILAPFINLFNEITGSGELLSTVNPYYYNTGLNLTNVRTFFGTLYLYSNWVEFIGYSLLLSFVMYLLKICTVRYNNIFIYVIYFFECGLLCFGWFEFYFFHLTIIEFPAFVLVLTSLTIMISKRQHGSYLDCINTKLLQ